MKQLKSIYFIAFKVFQRKLTKANLKEQNFNNLGKKLIEISLK